MKLLREIILVISLSFISFSMFGQNDTVSRIKPGVQWDTAVVIKPVHTPEHLIGIKYDYSFTSVSMTPKMGVKPVQSPVNVAV